MQTGPDISGVHIIQQTPDRLVAEGGTTASSGVGLSTVTIVLLLAGLAFFAWRRQWVVVAAVAVLGLGAAFLQGSSAGGTTRLTLQPGAGSITWERLRGETVAETTTAKAGEFRTADVDHTSAGDRVVLTRWSGGQEFPLGSGYQADSASQQAVLSELRAMLLQGRGSTSDSRDVR